MKNIKSTHKDIDSKDEYLSLNKKKKENKSLLELLDIVYQDGLKGFERFVEKTDSKKFMALFEQIPENERGYFFLRIQDFYTHAADGGVVKLEDEKTKDIIKEMVRWYVKNGDKNFLHTQIISLIRQGQYFLMENIIKQKGVLNIPERESIIYKLVFTFHSHNHMKNRKCADLLMDGINFSRVLNRIKKNIEKRGGERYSIEPKGGDKDYLSVYIVQKLEQKISELELKEKVINKNPGKKMRTM